MCTCVPALSLTPPAIDSISITVLGPVSSKDRFLHSTDNRNALSVFRDQYSNLWAVDILIVVSPKLVLQSRRSQTCHFDLAN